MKHFLQFFLLSGFMVFFGEDGNGSFSWAGGCLSRGEYERIDDKGSKGGSGKRKVVEIVNEYEESFKNRSFFYTRLEGYVRDTGGSWTVLQEENPSEIKILQGEKPVFNFIFLDVGSSIREARVEIGKNTQRKMDLCFLFPVSFDQTIKIFVQKIEEDLNGMKTSTLPTKTFYFKKNQNTTGGRPRRKIPAMNF